MSPGRGRPLTRRALAALVLVIALAGCGGADPKPHVTVTLDWTPNPDHVGIYYARDDGYFHRAGLNVSINAPSDPTAPLKLVAAGRSDLAVSYEQEVFFAAEKGALVQTVAAVVGRPLNSIMAIEPTIRTLSDLKGRSIGITGVPADDAALDAALSAGGLTRADVTVIHVGYQLLPALLSHKVDAVLGVYRNVEGVELEQRGFHPTVIPLDRAGVPPYDELVVVANRDRLRSSSGYRNDVERFVRAFLRGAAAARSHPERSLSILAKVTASGRPFLARSTPLTLSLLPGPDGLGCLDPGAWRRFGDWMVRTKLLSAPIPVSDVLTTRFLPRRCG